MKLYKKGSVINIKNSVYIILAGILWGIISLFVTQLQEMGLNSMQVVSVRAFFSALILVVFLLIKDKSKLKIKLKDIPLFLGTGVFSIIFFNFCYFESIEVIGGAAVPALLLYTAPVFVMVISMILFKEKITGKKLIALVLTFSGLIFVTGAFSGEEHLSMKAILLGVGAGLGYALYSIFGKYLVPKYDAITIAAYTFIVASVFAVPFSGVFSQVTLFLSVKGIGAILALAVLGTVLPFLFYTKGLKGMDAGKASILATAEPFVAAIVGVLFFHEKMTFVKIFGMLLIFSAILILNISGKTSRKKSENRL